MAPSPRDDTVVTLVVAADGYAEQTVSLCPGSSESLMFPGRGNDLHLVVVRVVDVLPPSRRPDYDALVQACLERMRLAVEHARVESEIARAEHHIRMARKMYGAPEE